MSDKFNEYFDDFIAKKKAKQNKTLPVDTPISELPIWEEIKETLNYNDCIICKKPFEYQDKVEKCILCERYFHFEELRNWILISKTCPSCKNEI